MAFEDYDRIWSARAKRRMTPKLKYEGSHQHAVSAEPEMELRARRTTKIVAVFPDPEQMRTAPRKLSW